MLIQRLLTTFCNLSRKMFACFSAKTNAGLKRIAESPQPPQFTPSFRNFVRIVSRLQSRQIVSTLVGSTRKTLPCSSVTVDGTKRSQTSSRIQVLGKLLLQVFEAVQKYFTRRCCLFQQRFLLDSLQYSVEENQFAWKFVLG